MEMERGENQESGSIIRSIMVEQEEKNRELLDPLIVVMSAVNDLRDREREVLTSRFGLEDGKKVTLETVGDKYKITRERVRQIESSAIKTMSKEPTKDVVRLMRIIHSFLVEAGGLISIEELAEYFKIERDQRYEMELNALRLVMTLDPSVVALPKSDLLKAGWMKKDFSVKVLTESLSDVEKILRGFGSPVTEDEVWEAFTKSSVYTSHKVELTPAIVFGILNVSAKIAKASDGKWGLTVWPSVVPKRIRDKIVIVMEQGMKPVHFRDIAEMINRKFPGKPVLSRTVHNELIGDKRFVLVGRGMYALKSWGYKPGVVSDVIKRVIESTGRPMSTEEIVEAVMKDRYVKRNTVVANLQNREWFVKAGKGIYDIRK